MRWVTYRTDAGDRVGLLDGNQIFGLAAGTTLLGLIEAGEEAMRAAADTARTTPEETLPFEGAALAAPLPRPTSLRDSLGFLDHLRNCRAKIGMSTELEPVWTQIPAFYFGNNNGIAGPYDPVPVPPGCQWFDLELEVGAVIGKAGRDIRPEDAEGHIVGYTFFCDWTNRNAQMHESGLGIGQGKSKDMAVTLGPALVTVDELEPYRVDGKLSFEVSASVNGREITKGSLDQMDWPFSQIIAYLSRGVDMLPGDVIGSGTVPLGCLLEHLDTPNPMEYTGWLKPGDEVSLHSDALGTTRQTILAPVGEFHPLQSGF